VSFIADALTYGRSMAEARMTETLQFFTVALVFDEDTKDDVETETNVGATTPGRVKFTQSQGRDVEAGAQHPVVQRLEVHVPTGSRDVAVGTHVRVTASTADSLLVGNVYRVSERPAAGQTTAWRYAVEYVP
jgi:hypothetical protein